MLFRQNKHVSAPILKTIDVRNRINEPAHEILALFALRKLILQTRMRSYPVALDVFLDIGISFVVSLVNKLAKNLFNICVFLKPSDTTSPFS